MAMPPHGALAVSRRDAPGCTRKKRALAAPGSQGRGVTDVPALPGAGVDELLEVDRWFRFVADEATAELEDDDSEEDVLALEPRPDIAQLVEDELLMAMPLVPMHETCPVAVPMQAGSCRRVGRGRCAARKSICPTGPLEKVTAVAGLGSPAAHLRAIISGFALSDGCLQGESIVV